MGFFFWYPFSHNHGSGKLPQMKGNDPRAERVDFQARNPLNFPGVNFPGAKFVCFRVRILYLLLDALDPSGPIRLRYGPCLDEQR